MIKIYGDRFETNELDTDRTLYSSSRPVRLFYIYIQTDNPDVEIHVSSHIFEHVKKFTISDLREIEFIEGINVKMNPTLVTWDDVNKKYTMFYDFSGEIVPNISVSLVKPKDTTVNPNYSYEIMVSEVIPNERRTQ